MNRYELVIDRAGIEIRQEFTSAEPAYLQMKRYKRFADSFSITLYDYESDAENQIIGHWEKE